MEKLTPFEIGRRVGEEQCAAGDRAMHALNLYIQAGDRTALPDAFAGYIIGIGDSVPRAVMFSTLQVALRDGMCEEHIQETLALTRLAIERYESQQEKGANAGS
jgi:hypothetical protein